MSNNDKLLIICLLGATVSLMVFAYLLGMQAGMNKGHRIGYRLGKAVAKRQLHKEQVR